MKCTLWILGLSSMLFMIACTGTPDKSAGNTTPGAHVMAVDEADDEDGDDGEDVDIGLDEVSDAIKNAALAAVPGLVLTGAEKETEEGTLIYCLEGTANGEACEVEVTADGKVVEIEHGEDDD